MTEWLLIPLGFVVGVYGTITGAGGGFLLVPVLLFLYPTADPASITSISLGVVFCNSVSGSLAYARAGRIDYRSGWVLSGATVPGAVLGAFAVGLLARGIFDAIFGLLLIGLGVLSFLQAHPGDRKLPPPEPGMVRRTVTDTLGMRYEYHYYQWQGILFAAGTGFLSSLLGTGGGFIKVPIMVFLLNFPVHIATATSQFTLVVMALAGTAVHLAIGDLTLGSGLVELLLLVLGVMPGAQLGAVIARRLHGAVIIRLLGASLVLVGASLLVRIMS